MDYQHIDNQAWAWQVNDLYLQANSNIEDLSYIFEETTPIKTYADFDYKFDDCEILSKTPQVGKENPPPSKRRRVLDFNSDSEEISSSVLQSKDGIDAYDVDLPELDAFLQGDDFFPPAVNFGQTEAWITDCLNDTDLNISSDNGNASATSSVHIGVKEGSSLSYDSASSKIQRPVRSSRNIIFKGQKSYMRTPSKVPSAIAYPFDFIKPSSVQGHVTLKDINEQILTPKSKFKKVEEETVYPTSAFSGKPVVGKTKIPTRGQGSITIMRTKG